MTSPGRGAYRHPSAPAFTNAHMVAAELRGYDLETRIKVAGVVRTYGTLLETRIKANASGRPGPRAVTGDYRRTWHATFTQTATAPASRVGTSAPQAARLEYGFVGADRLGRVYNQQPYPHVAPAVAKTQPEFLLALERAVQP